MKILIIGSTGFIGTYIYNQCVAQGIPALGTSTKGEESNTIKYRLGDDPGEIIKIITSEKDDNLSAIITASISKISECEINAKETRKVNVEDTVELINHLVDTRARIIFLSSDAVFDGIKGNYKEIDDINPINEYGRQKAEVEEYLKNLSDSLVLRISKQYDIDIKKRHLISDIYNQAQSNQRVKCIKGMCFNPTYVADTASGIIECCKRGLSGIYHLASPCSMSRYDAAIKVVDKLDMPKEIVECVEPEELNLTYRIPLNTSMDVSKLKAVLKHDFKTMDEVLSEWHIDSHDSYGEYKNR
ncbi:MAG: sugar nucleotide-binding protein [Lachnospiraceae bacterium]|nr:sugar nucleotide-binding protein [Lachnospiraceae bacterium]